MWRTLGWIDREQLGKAGKEGSTGSTGSAVHCRAAKVEPSQWCLVALHYVEPFNEFCRSSRALVSFG
jgi:hypothetical protein